MLNLEQKQTLYYYLGKIYVPRELTSSVGGEMLLHLSDTTQSSIKPLRSLITKLKPQYIIHTGNLTADIKSLDLSRAASAYEIALRQTMALFANANAKEVHITLSSRDYEPSIQAANYARAYISRGTGEISLCNRKIIFGHRLEEIRQIPGDIYLFGEGDARSEEIHPEEEEQLNFFSFHEKEGTSHGPLEKPSGDPVFLNGRENIHVIHLPTMAIYRLRYPLGTQSRRRKEEDLLLIQ